MVSHKSDKKATRKSVIIQKQTGIPASAIKKLRAGITSSHRKQTLKSQTRRNKGKR